MHFSPFDGVIRTKMTPKCTQEQPALPALVLAAGLSRRMGAFKPLLPLGGVPLIRRVVGTLRTSGVIGSILVVTGHRAAEIEAALADAPVKTVFNARYETGEMLSSLLAGITAMPSGEGAGFLLAFADQPAVLSSTIRSLVLGFQALQPPLALPQYAGKRGHPLVLARVLTGEIAALSAPETLRTVVHRHLSEAALIPVDDRSVLEDLDTPADFARAQARHNNAANAEKIQ